jgi:hypothetical protein
LNPASGIGKNQDPGAGINIEFHMFISIFYMNKVFFTDFFLFLTGVMYGVQYNSAAVSK